MVKFICYARISTNSSIQLHSLDAQESALIEYAEGKGEIVEIYREEESGRKNERPKLTEALDLCRNHGYTLLVHRLDRLSRSTSFLHRIRDEKIKLIVTTQPNLGFIEFGIMALLAQDEAEKISERTRAALAHVRKFKKLGSPRIGEIQRLSKEGITNKADEFSLRLYPTIQKMKKYGVLTYAELAEGLNQRGIRSRQGKRFGSTSVRNLILRAERLLN